MRTAPSTFRATFPECSAPAFLSQTLPQPSAIEKFFDKVSDEVFDKRYGNGCDNGELNESA
jgi:hypothetical protein